MAFSLTLRSDERRIVAAEADEEVAADSGRSGTGVGRGAALTYPAIFRIAEPGLDLRGPGLVFLNFPPGETKFPARGVAAGGLSRYHVDRNAAARRLKEEQTMAELEFSSA